MSEEITSAIYAYGNGEMLEGVFNSIAMMVSTKNGAFYKPLLHIGAIVGGIWAISKAFWESSVNGLLLHWMIPLVVFLGMCVIRTQPVYIIDVLNGGDLEHVIKVDNVPIGLAKAAQTISQIGYKITQIVEIAFHTIGNKRYNATGMIFGAENLLEMKRYAITDEHLAETMREFVQNCVTYDLALELYSFDDLKTAPNIWALIKQHTSNVRMFSFCKPKSEFFKEGKSPPQDRRQRCTLVSCHEGAGELDNLLTAYKNKIKETALFVHLPHFYQILTGIGDPKSKMSGMLEKSEKPSPQGQDVLSQQIMMHSIIDAVENKCESNGIGTNFAIKRAYLQQRNTYEVAGGLAAKSLVVLRGILEALIYAAFIFIMPFSLIPMGFKIFLKWLWLLVWIQLWPPFYAILNSGIMTVSRHHVLQMPGIENGLTFLTSTGLHNMALDMQAYAAYASLSVPFLSYALLQGGISAMAQAASGIMSVAQSAGSAAAQDLTTGNYSYGNVQLDTLGYNNQTMHQHNIAPSLTTGHIREDYGDSSVTYGKDMIVNERVSQLPFDIKVSENASQELSDTETQSRETANRAINSVTHSENQIGQQTSALAEHVSQSKNLSHTLSEEERNNIAKAGHDMMSQAAEFGRNNNVGTQAACNILVNAARATTGKNSVGASISASASGTDNKTWQEALNFVKTSSFSQNYETLQAVTTGSAININDEIGKTMTKNLMHSQEESNQHQQQYEQSIQHANMCAQAQARIKHRAVEINRNKTQDFVNILESEHGRQKALEILHNPAAYEPRLKQFEAEETQKIIGAAMAPFKKESEAPSNTLSEHNTPAHLPQRPHGQESYYRIHNKNNNHSTSSPSFDSPLMKKTKSLDFDAAYNQTENKITTEEKRLPEKQDHIKVQVNQNLGQKKENITQDTKMMQLGVLAAQSTSSFTRMVSSIPLIGKPLAATFSTGAFLSQQIEREQKKCMYKKTEIATDKEQQLQAYTKEFYAGTQYEDDYKEPVKQISESNINANPKKK